MRRVGLVMLSGAVLAGALCGCVQSQDSAVAGGDAELKPLLLTGAEADAHGGWIATPDQGSVDGESPDCTGAPYDWPDHETIAHAAQFLDREDQTVSVVVKQFDDKAAVSVEALRGALAPCPPAGGVQQHGAMIGLSGDDSFAYQSHGTDDLGDFVFSNMLVACDDLMLEASAFSYAGRLDQGELEDLVAPVVARLTEAGGCAS